LREAPSWPSATRRLSTLADEVGAAFGGRAIPIVANLGQPEADQTIVERVLAQTGRIDSVIAVATRAGRGALVDVDLAQLREAFEVNVIGTLGVSRCAARAMRSAGRGARSCVSTLGAHSLPEAGVHGHQGGDGVGVMTMAKELGRLASG
jgi:NAD(P)-dependent dehydrogenase (short-subunit alcohol dehydrogenase family)